MLTATAIGRWCPSALISLIILYTYHIILFGQDKKRRDTIFVLDYQSTNIFRGPLCMPAIDDNYIIADTTRVIFPGILLHANIQRTHMHDQHRRLAYVVMVGLLIIVICREFDIGSVGIKKEFSRRRQSRLDQVYRFGMCACACVCIVRAHHVFVGIGWRAPARRQRLGPEKVTGARGVKTR